MKEAYTMNHLYKSEAPNDEYLDENSKTVFHEVQSFKVKFLLKWILMTLTVASKPQSLVTL